MATIKDVARRAGVSTMTVSRVINNSGYASQEARERVARAIAELDYLPNALARSLRHRQTKTVALVLADIGNPFFIAVARGAEQVASAHGFSLLFCNTGESRDAEDAHLSVLLQKRVDGVLLVPTGDDDPGVARLGARGVPTVLIDRRVGGAPADLVRGDSERGAYELVRHLIGLGHARIALITGPLGLSTAADRAAGYARALREAGLPVSEALICADDFSLEGGRRSTRRLLALDPRPTAIFGGNTLIAFGAFQALRAAGLRVPEDVSLVTFDDLPEAWLMSPFLTTANQPADEIGRRAAELLFERLGGRGGPAPREVVLPAELVVRRSSAPPSAAR